MSTNESFTEPEFSPPDAVVSDGRTYCAVHTTVETSLRCNKCGRYMCVKCAVRTPVGYRCKECVHEQQDTFFTATQTDYIIAGIVALVISVPIGFIVPRLGLLFSLLLALPAGGLIAQVVIRAVNKRRGRYIWIVVAAAIVIGSLVPVFPILRFIGNPAAMNALLPSFIYVVLVAAGASAMLRYGK